MKVIDKNKLVDVLFFILKGRQGTIDEIKQVEDRYDLSQVEEVEIINNEPSLGNKSALYKCFSNFQPNINSSLSYKTLFYKSAKPDTYDKSIFAPVENGVKILKDLENVTIIGSVFVEDNSGQRVSLGVSVTINNIPSTIEATGYIRRASGHNECQHQVIETFSSLKEGDVITISGKRNAVASSKSTGIEDKGMLSVLGFVKNN